MKYEDWVRYDKGDNKMGLDVYLANGKTYNTEWECDDYETIEINSTLYPEHLFKIGYFRSSYNSGGINRVANRYSLLDLYDIFDPHTDSYTFIPDWADAMKKCEAAIKQWDAYAMSDIGQYDSICVSANLFFPLEERGACSNEESLALFKEKYISRMDTGDAFSDMHGSVFTDGLDVRAVFTGLDILGSPSVYMVHKIKQAGSDTEWYTQALAIVKETIAWVLAQDNTEEYFLVWSS